jgi:Zn-dependent M28 family amino/carboxypeptidase
VARRIQRQQVAAVLVLAAVAFAQQPALTPEQQSLIDHISADSLRGHLSFIASDALEGRGTPSRGLDIAAEYIAAQFRRAGLEPIGDDGYFQTATLTVRQPNYEGFELTVHAGEKSISLKPAEALFRSAANFTDAPLVFFGGTSTLTATDVSGRIVFAESQQAAARVSSMGPALVLAYAQRLPNARQVFDAEAAGFAGGIVTNRELLDAMRTAADARITIHATAPHEESAKVRNIAAVLRGSDPALRETYVMLSAHYDHLGMRAAGEDRIFNGANDDGSGTVSVIEVASAFAAQKDRPKRSIVFVLFFGEELGLVGSRYYARHPLVPLAQTIADLELEQVGRTDDSQGPQIRTAGVTGFDFSDLPQRVAAAGELAGIHIFKDPKNSDVYFGASDNRSLAEQGVPAHTLSVAYQFPDYHGVGDEASKVDYENMAAVDRAVALGIAQLASEADAPKWNESYAPAKRYVEAGKRLHP